MLSLNGSLGDVPLSETILDRFYKQQRVDVFIHGFHIGLILLLIYQIALREPS
jgi:hypothetical protein